MRFASLILVAGMLAGGPANAFDPYSQTEIMTVLVVGATGQQGGAVAREWLRRGYQVRGLTRNPSSPRARALAEAGAVMVRGNLNDPTSLALALEGVDGVFLMTDFWEHGYDGEVSHGRNMIEAAHTAGIRHLVYSSVASADRATGIPHFDSKYDVERLLVDEVADAGGVGRLVYSSVASADRATGIPHFDSKYDVERLLVDSALSWTVIRPVSFMENFGGVPPSAERGRYPTPLRPDAIVQYVSVGDIGVFAAAAFEDPEAWRGVTLDIAGESLSVAGLSEVLGGVLGEPVEVVNIPWPDYEARGGAEMTVMMRWFDRVGYDVDVPALRADFPWMQGLDDYLRDAWGQGPDAP